MGNSNVGTYKKILRSLAVALVVLAAALPAILKAYLATPHAASLISSLLSDVSGQAVEIKKVAISDGSLHLRGLSLANPAGFQESKLLSIDSVVIKPVWRTLLSNNRTFEMIAVEGVAVRVRRNRAGVWNFSQLQRRFSSSKPSPGEMLVRNLAISSGTLQIEDHTFTGVTLAISNLATKGSQRSGISLGFDDPRRNRYALSGTARLGKDPELEMTLSSSSLSYDLSDLLKAKSIHLPGKVSAKLRLSVEFRNGKVRGSGGMGFRFAAPPTAGEGGAFSGTLSLAAGYDVKNDRFAVEDLTACLNSLLTVRASGRVDEVKLARKFEADIAADETDIGRLATLVPALAQGKIVIGGTLGKGHVHLVGNATDGITSARGNLELSRGSLMRDKQLILKNLHAAVAVSGTGSSLVVAGTAAQAPSGAGALLEALDAPFRITIDRQRKTVTASSPALFAQGRGMSFAGRFSYADGVTVMENAAVKAGDVSADIGRLSARIPMKRVSSVTVRYPLQAELNDGDVRRGDTVLKKVSGRLRGAYAYTPDSRWLEGTAELSAGKVAWRGKEAGASRVRAEFSESGGKADFTAALLGGSIHGTASFNPFAPQERVAFSVGAEVLQLAEVAGYAGLRGDTTISGGTLEAAGTGTYSAAKGLFSHIGAHGKNIAVTGRAGKTILSAGGVEIDGDISGNRVVINKALLTAGKGVAVRAGGAIDNAFQRDRHGRIAVTVPTTALTDVADTFLNVLPRWMQEATVEGSVAAEGGVDLHEGKILVDGAVTLAHAGMDAPTEKIRVTDMNGVLPLSLDLAGKAVAKPPSSSRFERRNYDTLVKQLRRVPEQGDTVTIGSGSFGGVRVDSVRITLRAGRGAVEIVSLDSSLYQGALLGRGFITAENGVFYRGDLLFNDLSLVQICKAFPAIAGYLSGRIDGIVSIQGSGKQLSGLTGFSEFWARETPDEKMLVSKDFLQRLSGKKLSGFFFSSDRPYDHAGIKAVLEDGFLTFNSLDISHTNFLGIRDLSVTIAPSQNRIAIDHLLDSIKGAAARGKGATGGAAPAEAPPATEFKWSE